MQLVAGFLYGTDEAFAVGGVTVQMAVGQPVTVLTLCSAAASALNSSQPSAAAVLCGIVTERPTRSSARTASSAAAV